MQSDFPLFRSHRGLAHDYWRRLVKPGDVVVDATCGNGHDTLHLAELVGPTGTVWAFDLQSEALEATKSKTAGSVVQCVEACHTKLASWVPLRSVRMVVYNLGYLPGGDRDVTTRVDTTLESVRVACQLLIPGGALSITCYPGHPEGDREQAALLDLTRDLDKSEWCVCHHVLHNRRQAPSLLLVQKVG